MPRREWESFQYLITFRSLRSFIRVALLAPVLGVPLFCPPLADHMVERFRLAGCLLPTQAFGVTLRARALNQHLLLSYRFAQAGEKCLVITQIRGADAASGALRKLLLIFDVVTLQFLQLGFGLGHPAVECHDAHCQPPLGILGEILYGFDAFGAGHERGHWQTGHWSIGQNGNESESVGPEHLLTGNATAADKITNVISVPHYLIQGCQAGCVVDSFMHVLLQESLHVRP